MSDERDHPYPPHLDTRSRRVRLGVALAAAPAAWLLHLVVSYAAVGPSCAWGAPRLLHSALTIAALLVAIPSGWYAFRTLRDAPGERRHGHEVDGARSDGAAVLPHGRHEARAAQRNDFLAATALANAAFFSAIIVLSWTAALVVSPCAP